nr:MAG TPA_asm: hypothetical protein [Caudoviricetes sp.]
MDTTRNLVSSLLSNSITLCDSCGCCLKSLLDFRIGFLHGLLMKFTIVFTLRLNNYIVTYNY